MGLQRTNLKLGNIHIVQDRIQLLWESYAQGVFDPSDRLQKLACCQTVDCKVTAQLICKEATTPIRMTQKTAITSGDSTNRTHQSTETPPAESFNIHEGSKRMSMKESCSFWVQIPLGVHFRRNSVNSTFPMIFTLWKFIKYYPSVKILWNYLGCVFFESLTISFNFKILNFHMPSEIAGSQKVSLLGALTLQD